MSCCQCGLISLFWFSRVSLGIAFTVRVFMWHALYSILVLNATMFTQKFYIVDMERGSWPVKKFYCQFYTVPVIWLNNHRRSLEMVTGMDPLTRQNTYIYSCIYSLIT